MAQVVDPAGAEGVERQAGVLLQAAFAENGPDLGLAVLPADDFRAPHAASRLVTQSDRRLQPALRRAIPRKVPPAPAGVPATPSLGKLLMAKFSNTAFPLPSGFTMTAGTPVGAGQRRGLRAGQLHAGIDQHLLQLETPGSCFPASVSVAIFPGGFSSRTIPNKSSSTPCRRGLQWSS